MQPLDAVNPPLPAVKHHSHIVAAGFATRITAATARLMHQKRKEKTMAARNPKPIEPSPVDESARKVACRVGEIEAQIDLVAGKLLKAKEPRDMQALAMALDRLYGIWSLLTGHPRPGVRKDKPRRSIQTFATPLE